MFLRVCNRCRLFQCKPETVVFVLISDCFGGEWEKWKFREMHVTGVFNCQVPFLVLLVILRVNHWRQDGIGESIRYAESAMHVCGF